MFGRDIKTMLVISSGVPSFPDIQEPEDLFSAEEVDQLDSGMFERKSREELAALRRKLEDTFEWLDTGDCDVDSPEWKVWERRLDKLSVLMDVVEEVLNSEEDFDDEGDE